jgi:hypothetical protein
VDITMERKYYGAGDAIFAKARSKATPESQSFSPRLERESGILFFPRIASPIPQGMIEP